MKPENIDFILRYLPLLENPPVKLYVVDNEPDDDEDEDDFSPYIYSKEFYHFIAALYAKGFLLMFEWVTWASESNNYIEHPELIQAADLITLRKLLTTHFYLERFVNGHLARLIDNGHFVAILNRLSELRKEMVAGISK